MLQLIKNPIETVFMNLLLEANNNVSLCAPFIKQDIVKKILETKKNNTNLVVVTTSNIASFVRKASDIEAIELLLKNNIKVYNHQHLHAKIYSFDKSKAIITSANLTYNGLIKNYEYSVLISDSNIVNVIENDFQCLIEDELSGEFNLESVEFIKKQIEFYKNIEYKIIVDDEGDEKLNSKINHTIVGLQSWQKDIYDLINENVGDEFNLQELYLNENKLKSLHPNNNNIKPKIRQVLQQLRDKGLIKFMRPGYYKKLIK